MNSIDYIIIGGGIYGAGVAWELARAGREVMLLEAGEIASGASGGLGRRGVRANGRDLRELPLMRLAYDRWPTLHEEIGGSTGYERIGHLDLIENESDLQAAPHVSWMQNKQGVPTRMVERAELCEMEPALGEEVIAARFCPNDGVADHTATTRSMAMAAQKAGAVVREQTQVTALERGADRIEAVQTAAGERIAVGKELTLLSNAHVPLCLEQTYGLHLPVWQILPQVMLTNPVDTIPIRHLIGHASRVLAIKPEGQQVMISGGWRGRWNESIQDGERVQRGETVAEQVAGNYAEAVAVYPFLDGVGVAEADASRLEMVAVDGIPIIDRVENVTFASGWSGHGWAIAPTVTRLMAKWIVDGKRSDLLRPFGLVRFGI